MNGESITVGSKNVKDSSGLSLKNLIIGSEGTLAFITKCILRLLPKPAQSGSILISYNGLIKIFWNMLLLSGKQRVKGKTDQDRIQNAGIPTGIFQGL